MNALRTTLDVAAAIVAWHNRHPLARRITPAQVHDIGLVKLPLATQAPPPSRSGQAHLLFASDALYHARPQSLARWLHQHAMTPCEAPPEWPRRRFEAEASLLERAAAAGADHRLDTSVMTAGVDVDGKRLRVLLTDHHGPTVFGSRAYNPRRVAGSAMLSALLAASITGVGIMTWPSGRDARSELVPPPLASRPASAAEVRNVAAADAPVLPPSVAASLPSAVVAEVLPSAASAAPAIEAAANPPTNLGRFMVSIAPEHRETARAQSQALRAATAAASAASAAASSPPSLRSLLTTTAFAVATPATSRRDDAQAQLAVLRSVMALTATDVPTRLEVMPAGSKWRVVWWPHPTQAFAEQRQADARARGIRTEVIRF